LGVGIIYALTGSTNIYLLTEYFAAPEPVYGIIYGQALAVLGAGLILTSILFKLALVPFHL
jgi:NADH:ubiquinone oxidoreductase subunit 2 (subunit N)